MNVNKEQNGITLMLVTLLLVVLSSIGGVGFAIFRERQHPATKSQNGILGPEQSTTNSELTSNQLTPPMGIDYPVPQGIKGRVFCTDKIDPVPCPTKIEFEIQPSNPDMGSYGPVRTFETDDQGNFDIDLAPGSYWVTPAPKSNYPIFVPPLINPIIVKDRQVTEITINYHSGTR